MDNRYTLALKYYEAKLPEEAWKIVRDLASEPNPTLDLLRFAATLRLEAQAFDQVVEIANRISLHDPTDVSAWLFKAQAFFLAGRTPDGEHAWRTAAAMPGHHPAGWNNLGNLFDDLGRADDAHGAYVRAIQEAPELSVAHNNLGLNLAGQGRFSAAAVSHRKALECDPLNSAAMTNLGVALLEQGLIADARAAFDSVLAAEPHYREAADNRVYTAIYDEEDPQAVFAAHAAWGKAMAVAPPLRPAEPDPSRRLRVGYVSPDFRRHSVSFFLEPLFAAHDSAAVEMFAYADVAQADEVTARLKAFAGHWRDVRGRSDDDLFNLIRADRIDVLVDLAGHTKGNRLEVFARRAAPVQVAALGYPATTGLPAMDYRLCDAVTDPPVDGAAWSVESLAYLNSGMHCYAPPHAAPAPAPPPAVKAGTITFGGFNKLAKISPATVALWAQVLAALPTAHLILKTKPLAEAETRTRIEKLFGAHGIDAGRLDLLGWMPGDHAHLDVYNRVDIALDTYPYNGTTTTCEALWMGVPVLTLAGAGHAGRVGASLLSQVGMTDWIAATPEEFVARAVRAAAVVPALAALRSALRERVASSPLCDGPAHARAVEAAYRKMWRAACAATGSSAD